ACTALMLDLRRYVVFLTFSFPWHGDLRALHSFPTRRSSDLPRLAGGLGRGHGDAGAAAGADHDFPPVPEQGTGVEAVMNAGRTSLLTKLVLLAGFLFLYAPMFSLIVYSFNESRLVTVWSGFSVKWYYELFQDK